MPSKPEGSHSTNPYSVKSRAWRLKNAAKNREYKRRYHYRYKYGIDYETLEQMKASQTTCPICQEKPKRWHVDHDHETGVFRGLICDRCNKAIGMLGDSAAGVMRAVEYLRLATEK